MVFAFFCWKIIPESPRWLVTKGQAQQATSILEEIAKVNGAKVPDDLGGHVKALANALGKPSYGYLSLFRYI